MVFEEHSLNEPGKDLEREIWKSFSKEQHVFLATVEGDQPRVRPVTLIHLKDRLYVTTGTGDAKVQQIKGNAKTEFCLLLEEKESKGTLRAECIAKLIEDKNAKNYVYHNISFSNEFWKNPEDPDFTLIELQPVAFEYMKPGATQAKKISM